MKNLNRATRTGALLLAGMLVSIPGSAQVDLSGEWAPVRAEDSVGNPEIGDWVGIPLSQAGILRAAAWDASIYTLPEWQCRPHSAAYITRGPSQLRISKEVDPVSREVVAWHMEWLRSVDRPIYMDGRPHPPEHAAHTWAGFSTGEWVGDMLKITTTHLKEEYYKRNGVFHSDRTTLTNYLIRRGNYLTWVIIAYDPVYLTEPLIRSTEYVLDLHQNIPPYPCTVVMEVDRPKGVVPHHLPGTNPFLTEFATRFNFPPEIIKAGAATMYPEIQAKLKGSSTAAGKQ